MSEPPISLHLAALLPRKNKFGIKCHLKFFHIHHLTSPHYILKWEAERHYIIYCTLNENYLKLTLRGGLLVLHNISPKYTHRGKQKRRIFLQTLLYSYSKSCCPIWIFIHLNNYHLQITEVFLPFYKIFISEKKPQFSSTAEMKAV